MIDVAKNLEGSWTKRKEEARRKALDAVKELQLEKKPVNFNSVHKRSKISKSFLYEDSEIRITIEQCREHETNKSAVRHEKYDKTSRSKDVIIKAKDKRIAKLEEENGKLRCELEVLRGRLYDTK